MSVRTTYLQKGLDPKQLKKTVRQIVEVIKASGKQFDAIAFSGSSGLLVAPLVAARLNKGMILVRKQKPGTGHHHSSRKVEGMLSAQTYIIIDDQICTGDTLRRIRREIRDCDETFNPECVGILLYQYDIAFIPRPEWYTP